MYVKYSYTELQDAPIMVKRVALGHRKKDGRKDAVFT
jgi:hypothetical protein